MTHLHQRPLRQKRTSFDSGHCDRFVRVEGFIVIVVIFLCWFVGISLYEEDMSLTRYAIILSLIMLAICLLVRFAHWAGPDTVSSVVNVRSASI